MSIKHELKEKAISLRQRGWSYTEILEKVSVAKSTLSLWLRSVNLSKRQKQRITQKKLTSAHRGGLIRKTQRLTLTKHIVGVARESVGKISKRELWLIGIALYWAEGAKEKEHHPGSGVRFSNSDPKMVKIFLCWLEEVGKISREDIKFSLFVHENHKDRIPEIKSFWSKQIAFPESAIAHVYLKKHNPKTIRRNVGQTYQGLVQVNVRSSSTLNRKIAGWIEGVIESL